MFLFLLSACGDTLTTAEAKEAVDQAVSSAKAEGLTTEIVEITTDFTLGDAVEEAAENLRGFVESQIPCSTVSRTGATVSIDFGTLEDACTWNGETYAGVASVTVERVEGTVEVTHVWDGITNGEVTVDGDATVTWDLEGATRNVVHNLSWTEGSTTVEATGDRTQYLLDPDAGISGGIGVDGTRTWVTAGDQWELAIDGVEMRAQDPCPQAGTYTLVTPGDKTATLTFTRIDDDTIEVTLEGTRRPYTAQVTRAGN